MYVELVKKLVYCAFIDCKHNVNTICEKKVIYVTEHGCNEYDPK